MLTIKLHSSEQLRMQNHVKSNKTQGIIFCIIIAFFVIEACIQSTVFLYHDNSWLIIATKRMLHGGHYFTNFMETNPPLILYLYSIPVLAWQYLHINIDMAFRAFIFICIAISLLLSNHLLTQLQPKKLKPYHLLSIAFVLIFLAGSEFGQREHLTLIFLIPYLLHACVRAKNLNKSGNTLRWIVALLAAIAFSMKPYFIPAWILVELSICYQRKSWCQLFALESWIIAIFMLLYLSSIILFFPNYIDKMLPLINSSYFYYARQPWSVFLNNFFLETILVCLLVPIINIARFQQRSMVIIFSIASTALTAAFIFPRQTWFYHALPAIGVATILLLFLVIQLCAKWKAQQHKMVIALSIIIFVLFPLRLVFLENNFNLQKQYFFTNPEKAIQIVKKHTKPGDYIASFNTYSHPWPVVVLQTQTRYSVPMPEFWFLSAITNPNVSINTKQQLKQLMYPWIINHLIAHPPKLVFIDTRPDKPALYARYSYLQQLTQYPQFRKFWKHYHNIGTVDRAAIYLRKP